MATSVKEHDTVTAAVPGHADHLDGGVDVLDGGVQPERTDILGRIWFFLISMRTGLILMLILGVFTLIGTLLMQAASEVLADPASYQQWYAMGPKQRYGGWAPIFDALGFYHVFSMWYFQALFALLAVSILACSINRAPRLWRIATRPKRSMKEAFFDRAPLAADFTVAMTPDAAASAVRDLLGHARFRVLDGDTKKGADVYADKFRWGPFGTVMAHLSFVVILSGFVASAYMGFKDNNFVAPIGVPVAVGHDTGLTLEAKSFVDSYYPDGAPKDYVSDLVLTKNGVQVARQDTRVNTPLIYDDVWFHQASFGIGADITATMGDKTLYNGTLQLYSSEDDKRVFNSISVPNTTFTVYAVQAASGALDAEIPAGSTLFEVYTDATSDPTIKVVEAGKSVTIDGLTLTYNRNRQFTLLAVNRDPGAWLVWVGSTLLILGSFLVFFLPHRRLWVRIRPNADGTSRVRMGAPLRRDPAFEPVFNALAERIKSPNTSDPTTRRS